ncbi:unnamed protein product, partial [Meganyctiphanes norvegica]
VICLPGDNSPRTTAVQSPLSRPKTCPKPSNSTSVIHLPYTTVICLPGDNSPRSPLAKPPKVCTAPTNDTSVIYLPHSSVIYLPGPSETPKQLKGICPLVK